MNRVTGLVLLVLIAAFSAMAAETVTERHYRDYTFRITGEPDIGARGRLEIFKAGEAAYSATRPFESYTFGFPTIGADLLGTGEPILVVSRYSGGAHCCYATLLFGIGEKFRVVDKMQEWDSPGVFRRLGGKWLYEEYDGTFRYWKTAFAFSPQCRVILGYQNGSWRLVADRMRRRPFDQAQLVSLATTVSSDGWDESARADFGRYNPELWEYMLDMIYSGNPDQAYQFLDLAWPKQLSSEKDRFRQDFVNQLHTSPYWSEIAEIAKIPLSRNTATESRQPLCAGP